MSVLRPFCMAFMVACIVVGSGCSRIPDIVKIGVAHPLSGPESGVGQDLLNGVRLAVEEINEQGLKIDGKNVRLQIVSVDDQADEEVGKVVAQRLIDAGVVAVIGHLNSGVSIAAAPLYAAHNIPQLSVSTKPEYTQLGLDTTFRLVGNDAMQSKALGAYAATQMNGKVFALVDDGTAYGKNLIALTAIELKRHGKTIALARSLDDKATEFPELIRELKELKVDTYVTTQLDVQVAALADQMARAGLKDIQIIASDSAKTDLLPAMTLGIRAVYATSPIIEAREFRSAADFLPRFRDAFKSGDPSYGAHYTFDAVHVLAAAMRRTGSVTPKILTAELKRIDALAPVTHSVRFREDGEQFYPVISVYKVERGRWEPITRSDAW